MNEYLAKSKKTKHFVRVFHGFWRWSFPKIVPYGLCSDKTGRKTVFARPLVPGGLVRKNTSHIELIIVVMGPSRPIQNLDDYS